MLNKVTLLQGILGSHYKWELLEIYFNFILVLEIFEGGGFRSISAFLHTCTQVIWRNCYLEQTWEWAFLVVHAVCLNIHWNICFLSFSLLIGLVDVMNDRTVDEVKITAYFQTWQVVHAYMHSFVLLLCHYSVSLYLKLPCTLALWYFHKKITPK